MNRQLFDPKRCSSSTSLNDLAMVQEREESAIVTLEEFRWNLKRLLHEAYRNGIFVHDIEEVYFHWFSKNIKPYMFKAENIGDEKPDESRDWVQVFCSQTSLRRVFVIKSVERDVYKLYLRPGTFTPEETKFVMAVTEYSSCKKLMHQTVSAQSVDRACGDDTQSLLPAVSFAQRPATANASSQCNQVLLNEIGVGTGTDLSMINKTDIQTQTAEKVVNGEVCAFPTDGDSSRIDTCERDSNLEYRNKVGEEEHAPGLPRTHCAEVAGEQVNDPQSEEIQTSIKEPDKVPNIPAKPAIDNKPAEHQGCVVENQEHSDIEVVAFVIEGKGVISKDSKLTIRNSGSSPGSTDISSTGNEKSTLPTEAVFQQAENNNLQKEASSTSRFHTMRVNSDMDTTIPFESRAQSIKKLISGRRKLDNVHKCTYMGCQQMFDSLESRQKHVIQIHLLKGLKYKCSIEGCKRAFSQEEDALRHSALCSTKRKRKPDIQNTSAKPLPPPPATATSTPTQSEKVSQAPVKVRDDDSQLSDISSNPALFSPKRQKVSKSRQEERDSEISAMYDHDHRNCSYSVDHDSLRIPPTAYVAPQYLHNSRQHSRGSGYYPHDRDYRQRNMY